MNIHDQDYMRLSDCEGAAGAFDQAPDSSPHFVSYGSFEMSANGLTAEIKQGRGSDKPPEQVWIAAAFEIMGCCRNPIGNEWGKVLRWRDGDGRKHTRHVPDAAWQREPSDICALLVNEGLRINRMQQRMFANYISGASVNTRITTVLRTGWHDIGGVSVFVLPEITLGPTGVETVLLDTTAHGPYEVKGTLNSWRRGIGSLASGHALPILAISSALAGPLLHMAGQEGGGVNFFGQSSRGKTTLLQMAASVWGRGGSPGYVRAWRATANGLEGAAASASDTALILDELGQVDAREATSALYSLSNGGGKIRAARDGGLREPKGWRVMVLSTGEFPIEAKLTEDRGRKAKAGQLVRMLDIPAERGFGVFDHAGAENDAGALAKAFKQAAITDYGTAGPEFVQCLISEQVTGEYIRAEVGAFIKGFVPAGSDGQIERAAQRLGLIATAGELATHFGLTTWRVGEAKAAAAWALKQWIGQRGGTESVENRQAIEQVRLCIEQHGESRFQPLDNADAHPVKDRLGWRKDSGKDCEWMIPPETWKSEICKGMDPRLVARVLCKAGMLERASDGYSCVRPIEGSSKRVYIITAAILAGGENAD